MNTKEEKMILLDLDYLDSVQTESKLYNSIAGGTASAYADVESNTSPNSASTGSVAVGVGSDIVVTDAKVVAKVKDKYSLAYGIASSFAVDGNQVAVDVDVDFSVTVNKP